ncbi:MAG: hypothetical protein ABIT10_00250 [Alteraurantiacibacter sp.]
MKRIAFASLALAITGCSAGDAELGEQPYEAETREPCRDNDPLCFNTRLMERIDENARLYGAHGVEDCFGNWMVVAAIERVSPNLGGDPPVFLNLNELRRQWIGSRVTVGRDAITMSVAPGARVTRSDDLSHPGDLYPHCTRPQYDTDMRNSAGEMESGVDPWRDFGLQPSRQGRIAMVRCNGELEYPDDGTGDFMELTVEEAEGVSFLYVYSPDQIILGWGAVELLLRRAPSLSS